MNIQTIQLSDSEAEAFYYFIEHTLRNNVPETSRMGLLLTKVRDQLEHPDDPS